MNTSRSIDRLVSDVRCIVWLMTCATRVRSLDVRFFKKLHVLAVRKKIKIMVVLTWCDVISPGKWDVRNNRPSKAQERSLELVRAHTSGLLQIPDNRVLCVSAIRNYNISELRKHLI